MLLAIGLGEIVMVMIGKSANLILEVNDSYVTLRPSSEPLKRFQATKGYERFHSNSPLSFTLLPPFKLNKHNCTHILTTVTLHCFVEPPFTLNICNKDPLPRSSLPRPSSLKQHLKNSGQITALKFLNYDFFEFYTSLRVIYFRFSQ